VVGLLGILKAGGAYVPLDPSYPIERLAYMLADSTPVVLLTQPQVSTPVYAALRLEPLTPGKSVALIHLEADAADWAKQSDSNPDPVSVGLTPEHLAYVIYTSGSTGQPKGVMVNHRGLTNYLCWARKSYMAEQGSVVSSSLSFDATITSLLTPLTCGG